MKLFDRLSVLNKLLLSFSVVIVFGIAVGVTGMVALSKMNEIVIQTGEQHMDGLYWMEESNRNKQDIDLAAASLHDADDATQTRLKQRIVTSLKSMHDAFDHFRPSITTPHGHALYAEVLKRAAVWEDIVTTETGAKPTSAGLSEAAQIQQAIASSLNEDTLIQHEIAARGLLRDKIGELIEFNRGLANAARKDAATEYESMRFVMLALVLTAVASGMVLAVVIGRRLSAQLGGEPGYAAEIANRVAVGDLTVQVTTRAGDEASLLHALRNMSEKLAGIIRGIRESSESVSLASREIAQGNTDLSHRTEEQAALLEETASSMEELTATVRQNADNTQQATTLACEASEVSAKGSGLVDGVVDTMRELAAGSKLMTDIIAVIEGIAFQTNILALNAAVEAARAGEQGRGFAVVAGEVRSLAQRSAVSAKEIKELIKHSTARVDSGAALAEEAGRTMTEVTRVVQHVANIMNEISAATAEQSTGIEQVNRAISQMDEMTQQNAALVEEAAAAAGSLADQAQELKVAVSSFELNAQIEQQISPLPTPDAAPTFVGNTQHFVRPAFAPDRRESIGMQTSDPLQT